MDEKGWKRQRGEGKQINPRLILDQVGAMILFYELIWNISHTVSLNGELRPSRFLISRIENKVILSVYHVPSFVRIHQSYLDTNIKQVNYDSRGGNTKLPRKLS